MEQKNKINIVILIPLICFGLIILEIIIGSILNINTTITSQPEAIQHIYNIFEAIPYFGAIAGIPIGIIFKNNYNKTICILDIIVGIITILFMIIGIIIVLLLVKTLMISAPGILQFLNDLASIG